MGTPRVRIAPGRKIAEQEPDAEQRKQVVGSRREHHRGLTQSGDHEWDHLNPCVRDVFERRRAFLDLASDVLRQRRERVGDRHRPVVQLDQPVGLTVWKRPEHQPIDDRQEGDIGPDPQRAGQHRRDRQAGRPPERTPGPEQVSNPEILPLY
jgi:hypothetical protein